MLTDKNHNESELNNLQTQQEKDLSSDLDILFNEFIRNQPLAFGDIVTWKSAELQSSGSDLQLEQKAVVITKYKNECDEWNILHSYVIGFVYKGEFITECILSNRLRKIK